MIAVLPATTCALVARQDRTGARRYRIGEYTPSCQCPLAARLVLAAVFAVAGTTKLAEREGSIRALEGFGVPTHLSPIGACLLPLAELAVAIGLVFPASAWVAAVAAAALLGMFTAAIGLNLARGRGPLRRQTTTGTPNDREA